MAEGIVVFLVIWAGVFGYVSGRIWASKGGAFETGFAWGAILGFVGLIYVAAATPVSSLTARRLCPFCKEPIHEEATVCPHCGRTSEPSGSGLVGSWALVLEDPGPDLLKVERRIAQVTDLSRAEAREAILEAPAPLASIHRLTALKEPNSVGGCLAGHEAVVKGVGSHLRCSLSRRDSPGTLPKGE